MSWAVAATGSTWGDGVTDALMGELARWHDEYVARHEAEPPPEVWQQINAARLAAMDLIRSHGLGDGEVRVTLSGHANPGRRYTEPVTPDSMTVQVTRIVTSPAAAAAEAYGGTAEGGT